MHDVWCASSVLYPEYRHLSLLPNSPSNSQVQRCHLGKTRQEVESVHQNLIYYAWFYKLVNDTNVRDAYIFPIILKIYKNYFTINRL